MTISVNLQTQLQPGQKRDPSLDQQMSQIEKALNDLQSQITNLMTSSGVSSITENSPATGAIVFTGAGVSQAGNNFSFGGGGGGSGTVTSVAATAPLLATPGPIVGAGTISHLASGVGVGPYISPNITVDAEGHVTLAASHVPAVGLAAAFGHTITATRIDLFCQQVTPGDTVQALPQLIQPGDRGILGFITNGTGFVITVNAHAGETINGLASLTINSLQSAWLIGLGGSTSTGDWSSF